MKVKRHLTVEGLNEIVRIKGSLNLGLSDEIKGAFAETLTTSAVQERTRVVKSIPHQM